ncbi:hypothetical protein NGRA_1406 [Nosema granulosis]|uniref:Uncharacterized protein n=1 Tax=Nosema granulosis TaxID=83296 RepID=A0A9P6GZ05_9MICR|nr:hypothetical protein NGRA_1406 [Nosema granulosis]
MDFRRKIKNILDWKKGFEFKKSISNSEKSLVNQIDCKISTGVLSFVDIRNEEYRELFLFSKEASDEYYPYFHFTVSDDEGLLCSVTMSGLTLFSDIKFMSTSQNTFFNIKDVVYMDSRRDQNEVKRMFSASKIYFKDWNLDIYSVLKNEKCEILFFNGSKFLSLIPTKIIFSKKHISDYFRVTDLKNNPVKCNLCGLKEYTYLIDENPVIPKKYNRVCRSCLEVLEKNPTHL